MNDNNVVPLETLRAELNGLELRLVDRINAAMEKKADLAHLEQLEARVGSLELSRAAREQLPSTLLEMQREINDLKRFRYAVPSVAVISLLVAVALAALTYL